MAGAISKKKSVNQATEEVEQEKEYRAHAGLPLHQQHGGHHHGWRIHASSCGTIWDYSFCLTTTLHMRTAPHLGHHTRRTWLRHCPSTRHLQIGRGAVFVRRASGQSNIATWRHLLFALLCGHARHRHLLARWRATPVRHIWRPLFGAPLHILPAFVPRATTLPAPLLYLPPVRALARGLILRTRAMAPLPWHFACIFGTSRTAAIIWLRAAIWHHPSFAQRRNVGNTSSRPTGEIGEMSGRSTVALSKQHLSSTLINDARGAPSLNVSGMASSASIVRGIDDDNLQ